MREGRRRRRGRLREWMKGYTARKEREEEGRKGREK